MTGELPEEQLVVDGAEAERRLWAAGRLGIGYEAAKNRRQRAGGLWWVWWDPPAQRANRGRHRLAVDAQRPAAGGSQEPAA